MKIDYEFNNGDVSEVEVSEEIGRFIIESRRAEVNNNRRQKDHNVSITDFCYEGEDFAVYDDVSMTDSVLEDAFSVLSETERRRLLKYIYGLNMDEIAIQEGVHKNAVFKSIRDAREKIKSFLKKF